jgi:DNA polymerase elongation subunit (family B)
MQKLKRRLAVLDLETDPFEFGKIPMPFLSGFYDGENFESIWNLDCCHLLVARLKTYKEPLIIFAHNGGKFDFFYFLEYLEASDMRIVNGRIIQAQLGEHELRDSFALMPFRLADYMKDEIDYNKLHKSVREQHRDEIIRYLRGDCVYLHELVTAFFDEFGDKLTVGSSSMTQLERFHDFERGSRSFDDTFRKDFYFGGRNQCFESGIIRTHIKIYDVNSMYPHVMKSYLHPVGTTPIMSTKIERDTCFVTATGHNYGAFPVRSKTGALDFTVPYGTFNTTIHEWEAALDTQNFKPDKVIKTYGFSDRVSFAEFIDHFYFKRLVAKKRGDKMHTLFYKFVLNSAYGKFAQNPENYFEWRITPGNELLTESCGMCKGKGHCTACDATGYRHKDSGLVCRECEGSADCHFCGGSGFKWRPEYEHQGKYTIWCTPLSRLYYYNVATGASITGAARAVLLRGIRCAIRPLYCDTDSIICEDLDGVFLHESELGAWKLEGEGERAAICGKKLYAVFDASGEVVKKAHKGARLTGHEILRIAKGETVEARNPVPGYKLDGKHAFTTRRISRTA